MARAACPPAAAMTGSGFMQICQGEVSSQNPETLQSCLFSGTQVSRKVQFWTDGLLSKNYSSFWYCSTNEFSTEPNTSINLQQILTCKKTNLELR